MKEEVQIPFEDKVFFQKTLSSNAYEKHILLSLMGSTVEDVSLKEKLGYEAVMGIIRRQVQSEVNWELISSLEQLGLDEISLKKDISRIKFLKKNFILEMIS